MQAADTTMYWAKADGRDRYAVFDADRHHADVSRFALSARMPEALARGRIRGRLPAAGPARTTCR